MKKIIKRIRDDAILMCKCNPSIITVLIVGSYARNEQKEGSDIDLVVITNEKEKLIIEDKWIKMFGEPKDKVIEEWGEIKSLRVKYKEYEIEFGIGTEEWIRMPLDRGTERVLRDGYIIIFDRGNSMQDIGKYIEEKYFD